MLIGSSPSLHGSDAADGGVAAGLVGRHDVLPGLVALAALPPVGGRLLLVHIAQDALLDQAVGHLPGDGVDFGWDSGVVGVGGDLPPVGGHPVPAELHSLDPGLVIH